MLRILSFFLYYLFSRPAWIKKNHKINDRSRYVNRYVPSANWKKKILHGVDILFIEEEREKKEERLLKSYVKFATQSTDGASLFSKLINFMISI